MRLQGADHDRWKEALNRMSARVRCNTRTEPGYTSDGVAAVGRHAPRGNIEVTLPPPHGPTLLDISIFPSSLPDLRCRRLLDARRCCRSV
jgi:hypothetical protein